MADRRIVTGEILFPTASALPEVAASVVVRIEDVSRADVPSVLIAEKRLSGVLLARGEVLPFELEVPENAVDPRHSYSVSVHVDIAGSGEVERGDLVSTQSHPVLTRGAGLRVRVPVRRV